MISISQFRQLIAIPRSLHAIHKSILICFSYTTPSLALNVAWRPTEPCWTHKKRAKLGQLAYQTSKFLRIYLTRIFTSNSSGLKHLEEIKDAGLQMPAVNQIEACLLLLLRGGEVTFMCTKLHPLCQQRSIVEYCNAHSVVVQAYCPIIRGQMSHPTIQAVAKKVCVTTMPPCTLSPVRLIA
jgi:hypothetical protein